MERPPPLLCSPGVGAGISRLRFNWRRRVGGYGSSPRHATARLRGGSRMTRPSGRLRRATVLVAVMATAGFTAVGISVPAHAAPTKPARTAPVQAPPPGPVTAPGGKADLGPVKRVCNEPTRKDEKVCRSLVRTDISPRKGLLPREAPPAGFGAPDLQGAYALPSATAGTGQTVAIIDAFDAPTAEADLAVYRAQYGLPACTTANGCFRKVNQDGLDGPLPAPEPGWASEIALDIQMVSAVCPNCKILLVESNNNQDNGLFIAINTAVRLGAKFVSLSWGKDEEPTDQNFDDPYLNHPGVVITASSGDTGYHNEFPAGSRYVTSVGGTSLTRGGGGRGWTETAWRGAGSGCSDFEAKPSFQTDPECPRRAYADVSAVADPQTGVAVYNTFPPAGRPPGWDVYGGTSASAPMIASIYALAGTPTPGTYPNAYPYSSAFQLNDVTSGSNGSCNGSYLCTAKPGYDGPTGLGTPNGVAAFAPPAHSGTITGAVTDAGDGHPIAGAAVKAGDKYTATTDAQGRYKLLAPVGTYDVSASAYGYQTKTAGGVAVADGGSTTADFALTALPRSTVSGTIRDGSAPGGPLYTDPTTGRYHVELVDNATYTLHVKVNYPGYVPVDQTVQVGTTDVVKDITVPVDTTARTAPGYATRYYGLGETFNSGTTPPGWSVVNNAPGGGWGFTDIGNRGNLTGGDGGFAMVDSDKLGVGQDQNTELRTPPIDLSGETNPTVTINSDYRWYSISTADVDLSLDGDTTWSNLLHYGSESVRGPLKVQLPIPQAAGKSGVLVRFHYVGRYSYWWEVDNVVVGRSACEPVHGGLVVGQVTDQNTGKGVDGATVTSNDKPAEKAVTAPTPNDPNLGDGFYWLCSSATGRHPFTAAYSGYTDQKKTVDVATDWATRADFTLSAGHLVIKPGAIKKTVGLGEQATATVTVKNDGKAPAQVRIGEQDGGFTLLRQFGAGAPLQNVNGQYSPLRVPQIRAKVTSPVKPAMTPYAAPWTDIANYPTPIMDNVVAVNDGKLYSVGGTDGTAIVGTGQVFNPATGAWTPIAPLTTAREKPAGAFVNGKLYVVGGWGTDGNPVSTLEIYNPATNTWSTGASIPTAYAASATAVVGGKLYVVGGCDATVCGKTAVYAYDPAADSWSQAADYPQQIAWSACGGLADQVYCAGGTDNATSTKKGYSYNPALAAWSPIPDLPLDLWASSYATANGLLLMSGGVTNNQATLTNQGVAFDPVARAWTALPNSNNTVYRGGGACGLYKVGGSVGNFNAVNKAEVLPGLGDCATATADVPWLSESPTSFTVAPGKTVTVTVTLDASVKAVSQPGTYAAQLTFRTDTPYTVAPVDVQMVVKPPATWGKIAGTVTGVKCDGASAPLAGATVQIDTWAQHFTLRTDRSEEHTSELQ